MPAPYFRRVNPLDWDPGNTFDAEQANPIDAGLETVSLALEDLEVVVAADQAALASEVTNRTNADNDILREMRLCALRSWFGVAYDATAAPGPPGPRLVHYSSFHRRSYFFGNPSGIYVSSPRAFVPSADSGISLTGVPVYGCENPSGVILMPLLPGGANKYARSSNGIAFANGTGSSIPTGGEFSVAFNGSVFVLVSTTSRIVSTSPDGLTWTNYTDVLPALAGFATPRLALSPGAQGGVGGAILVLSGSNAFAISTNGGATFTTSVASITFATSTWASRGWWDSVRGCWWVGGHNGSNQARLLRIFPNGTQEVVVPTPALPFALSVRAVIDGLLLVGGSGAFATADGVTLKQAFGINGSFEEAIVNCGDHLRQMSTANISIATPVIPGL